MENYKELLIDLINNSQSKSMPIDLFMGLKPANYYLPSIQIGSLPPTNELCYFIEIKVHNRLVLRESLASNTDDDENINLLCKRVLISLITNGLMRMYESYV